MSLNSEIQGLISKIRDLAQVGSSVILGLDIGICSIKLVELKKSGSRYKVVRYDEEMMVEGVMIENEIQKEDLFLTALNNLFSRTGLMSANVAIGLFGPNVLLKKLQLAGGTPEEIEDQVMWEIEQYLTFELDISAVTYHVMGENDGGGIDVLVGVAKNDVLEHFREKIEKAKFRVKLIETHISALANTFEYIIGEPLKEKNVSWVVIDFGAQKTNFIIYRNGGVFFNKEMAFGGVMITEEIQRKMGVNYQDGENLKIVGDGSGSVPVEIQSIIDDVVETFLAELKKTLEFYLTSTSDDSIRECYITGGNVLVRKLRDNLEPLFGVPVKELDPTNAFDFDSSISEEAMVSLKTKGLVALGLGMRELK